MAAANVGKYSKEFTSAAGTALNTAADRVMETAESVGDAAQKMATSILSVPSTGFQSGIKLLFAFASLALFLFLFLVGIHYTVTPVFSFFPGDAGILPIANPANKQVDFVAQKVPFDTACRFTDLYSFNTSFAFDLVVTSDFTSPIPRVVFYKSAALVPMLDTDTEQGLAAKFPNSNVVLFVDSVKNDLKALVHTASGSTIQTVIKNIPLRTPVRIGMVVFKQHVEVYQDGDLVATVAANGELLADDTANLKVWGPPRAVSNSVKTARITYWPYVISPKMFRVDAADKANPAWFA
jgi:hypothetical protein